MSLQLSGSSTDIKCFHLLELKKIRLGFCLFFSAVIHFIEFKGSLFLSLDGEEKTAQKLDSQLKYLLMSLGPDTQSDMDKESYLY